MPINVSTRQVGFEESITDVVNRINRRGLSVKVRANDFTQPLGRITQKADEFTKSLEASNARVIAFGASAAIIGGVTRSFTELVVQAVRVEKILTDINVVLGTSASNLDKFGNKLFGVAKNTAQTLEVAAEAALEFSRQGLSMEETLRRTNDALILTRLTGLKAADSVKGLTAAVNGFADAGLTTTSIINKLAAVDVKFAVGADDLINALARAGAVAQDAGVSFDQLVGAVTSAQQITARGGAVIGNSFKTIFTRVQRSSTIKRLEELGIAVRNIRGETLPALTVLRNLSSSYDRLAGSTKSAVAEQVGGVFQINVLKAALKDLNKENSLYSQATKISTLATDQAQRKNEQLQKTISALAAQTSLSVQELASNIGELALSPGISSILDAVNSFAESINNVLGDGEGQGNAFAKGIVKGIGSVITGPGMVLAFGVFAKLFANALKFAKSSLKDVLGIVTAKDKEKQIQESILIAMQQNKSLATELNKFAGDKTKQEQIMLAVIKEQTVQMQMQAKLAAGLAPGLRRAGVSGNLSMSKNGASGHVPNYASQNWQLGSSGGVTPAERLKEQGMAIKAGYSPGSVKKMSVSGLGDIVYNANEKVKMFPGMAQPAIMPPRGSRAGQKYGSAFKQQHGFNPYSSRGLVPNFMRSYVSEDKPPPLSSLNPKQLGQLKRGGAIILPNLQGSTKPNKKGIRKFQAEDWGYTPQQIEKMNPEAAVSELEIQKQIMKLLKEDINQAPGGAHMQGARMNLSSSKLGLFTQQMTAKRWMAKGKQGQWKSNSANPFDISQKHNQREWIESPVGRITQSGGDAGGGAISSLLRAFSKPIPSGGLGLKYIGRWVPIKHASANLKSGYKAHLSKVNQDLERKGLAGTFANIERNKLMGAHFEEAAAKEIGGGLINTEIGGKNNNSPSDLFGKGVLAWEAKAGGWNAAQLLAKSMRLFKERDLEKAAFDSNLFGGKEPSGAIKEEAIKVLESKFRSSAKIAATHGLVDRKWNTPSSRESGVRETAKILDQYSLAGGLIPNFSSPLSDAIRREGAAGVPRSMMRIERDNDLINDGNPLGLGVTNRMDEPFGIKQGIRRARSMGIDPQSHGAASGLFPNFAGRPASVRAPGTSGGLRTSARSPAAAAAEARLAQSADNMSQSTDMISGQLIAVTTIAYALQGAFQGVNGELGRTGRVLSGLTQGVSSAMMVSQGMGAVGAAAQNKKGMGGKFGRLVGKAGPIGALLALGAALAPLRKEFEMFRTPMENFKVRLEEGAKKLESLSDAASLVQAADETGAKIKELQNSNAPRTYKTELELLKLSATKIDQESKAALSINNLKETVGITDAEMAKLNGTVQERQIQLQKLLIKQSQQQAFSGNTAAFTEAEAKQNRSAQDGSFNVSLEKFNRNFYSVLSGITGGLADGRAFGMDGFNLDAHEKSVRAQRAKNVESFGINQARTTDILLSQLDDPAKKEARNLTFDLLSRTAMGGKPASAQENAKLQEYGLEGLFNELNAEELSPSVRKELSSAISDALMKNLQLINKQNDDQEDNQDIIQQQKETRLKILRAEERQARQMDQYIGQAKARSGARSEINTESLAQMRANQFIGTNALASRDLSNQFSSQARDNGLKNMQISAGSLKKSNNPIRDLILKGNLTDSKFTSTDAGKEGNLLDQNKGNLSAILKNVSKQTGQGDAEAVGKALGNATMAEHIQDALLQYLFSIEDLNGRMKAIKLLTEKEVFSKNVSLNSLTDIQEEMEDNLRNQGVLNKIEVERIDEGKKTLDRSYKTTNGLETQLINQRKITGSLSNLHEFGVERETNSRLSAELTSDAVKAELKILEMDSIIAEKQTIAAISAETRLSTDLKIEKEKSFQLEAEKKLSENSELSVRLAEQRVANQITSMVTGANNNQTNLNAQRKKGFFDTQATTDFRNNNTEQSRSVDAFNAKFNRGGFNQEGRFSVQDRDMKLKGDRQNIEGRMQQYAGNSLKTAELNVELAENIKLANEEIGNQNLFQDALRVRIAETNLEMERFGETLANTTFDAVKDSFKDLIKNMGDGTKSLGDMAMEFFGNIVSRIHDKLLDRAAAQITSGIMEAFGFNNGGIVSKYANGGSTGSVPAMLTSGEYVVRKKLVDKMGFGALNTMNQKGSLEGLYDKNNEESFELLNQGGMAGSSASRQNYISSGPIGTIAKAFGGLVKLFGGGFLSSNADDSAGMKISKGAGYLGGSAVAAYQNRGPGPEAPTAPKFSKLNTSSALNLDPRGSQMSSAYRANDQYSQDYKKYLLDKYQFDVNQKNAKVQNRANLAQGIVNSIGFMGISAGANAFGQKRQMEKQAQIEAQNSAVVKEISSLVPVRSGDGGELGSREQILASLQTNNSSIKGGNVINNQSKSDVNSILNLRPDSGPELGSRSQMLAGLTTNNSTTQNATSSSFSSKSSSMNMGRTNYMESKNYGANMNFDNSMERSSYYSEGGKVHGPAGIDKVGPVMLDKGEFVIKASSVNKIEKQHPGFFEQLNASKMKDGGVAGGSYGDSTNTTENITNTDSSSSNVTVNINVSSGGSASVDGGEANDQAFATKIKEAVLGIISQEKRVGGMLRGH